MGRLLAAVCAFALGVVACSSSQPSPEPRHAQRACVTCSYVGRCMVAPVDDAQRAFPCCAPVALYNNEPNAEMVSMCRETERAARESR
jgi:hypothetical protein